VRTQITALALLALVAACAPVQAVSGPIGEGAPDHPDITAVDSMHPPKSASVRLDKDAYVVLLLVAPGHSATLLYPKDSTTDNHLSAGAHEIAFQVPGRMTLSDTARRALDQRERSDSADRSRARPTAPQTSGMRPIMPNTNTFLLIVSSPQPLVYQKVVDKTVGWSIPLDDMEALNAVAKQVKSTITNPRDWSAAFHVVTLAPKK